MANIKFNVLAGLHNDYGIFNLRDTAVNQVYLDFVINGTRYVENDDFIYLHGGTSAYKEFLGIDPLVSDGPNWDIYGLVFASRLKHFFKNLVNGFTVEGEIYDKPEGTSDYKYVNYRNLFQLDFLYREDNIIDIPSNGDNEDNDQRNLYKAYSGYIYKDYKELDLSFHGKKVLKIRLAEAQTGVYLTLQAIHFSKYYPLYSVTSGLEKSLQPLLWDANDFEQLGFSLDNEGHPAVKDIISLAWHRYHSSRHRWEEMWATKYSWNGTGYGWAGEVGHYDEKTGSGHDWSLFNNSPIGGTPIQLVFNFDVYHDGFVLFDTMKMADGYDWPWYKINDWGDDAIIHSNHTNTFVCNGPNYNHFFNDAAMHNTYNGYAYFTLGIGFKYDSQHNMHFFNSYVTVNQYTLTIKYKTQEMADKYPPYLGQVVASIAASIYVYKEVESNNLHYISDIVYLGKNGTLYTQDIPFRMYVDPVHENHNDLLIIRGIHYDDYLALLLSFINHDDEKYDLDISDNNVNLHLLEIVKNSPVQFRLDYESPDLSAIGLTSYVTLRRHGKSPKRILSDIVSRGKLYQIDLDNNIAYLNQNLLVKWIDTIIKNDDDKSIAVTFYEDKPLYNNYEVHKIFNYNNEKLDCNICVPNTSNWMYNIYSSDGSYGNWFNGLVAEEIFWPEARIM